MTIDAQKMTVIGRLLRGFRNTPPAERPQFMPGPGEIVELLPGETFHPISLLRVFNRIDDQLGQYLNEPGRAEWWYRDHPDLGGAPIKALLDHNWREVERLPPMVGEGREDNT